MCEEGGREGGEGGREGKEGGREGKERDIKISRGRRNLSIIFLDTPKYFNILDSTLVSGSPGIISINMSANPEPSSVEWFYEGKHLNTGSRIKANASSLSFKPVDMSDIGRYAVRARNSVGLSKLFNVTPEVLCK